MGSLNVTNMRCENLLSTIKKATPDVNKQGALAERVSYQGLLSQLMRDTIARGGWIPVPPQTPCP